LLELKYFVDVVDPPNRLRTLFVAFTNAHILKATLTYHVEVKTTDYKANI